MSEPTYRTFEATFGQTWRWDGLRMEILSGDVWTSSTFSTPDKLLACLTITETTPKP